MTIFGPWATVSEGTSPVNTTSTDKTLLQDYHQPTSNIIGLRLIILKIAKFLS
jgi:hypothetical protein